MIIIVLAIFLILGFMIADAILDWIFIAVYALLAMATLNSLIHMFKYYRKHKEIEGADIGQIFLCIGVAAVVMFLQVEFL